MGPREILNFLGNAFIAITAIVLFSGMIRGFSIINLMILMGIVRYAFKDKRFTIILCMFTWVVLLLMSLLSF